MSEQKEDLATRISGRVGPTERQMALGMSLVFVGLNVYYFHRWAFKFNSTGTSPTYANTPYAWQSAKYVAVFVVAVTAWGAVFWLARSRGSIAWLRYQATGGFAPILAVLFFYFVAITAIWSSPSSSQFGSLVVGFFFIPIVLLMPTAPVGEAAWSIYAKAGTWLVAYHVAFSLIQIVFYFGADRLPALAYDNGALVRFGAGLDDPNGFGVMAVLPILIIVSMWPTLDRKGPAAVMLVLLAGLLFLTLSFSAAVGFGVGLLALAAITKQLKVLGVVFGVMLLGVVAVASSSYLQDVIARKKDSAVSRFDFGARRPGQLGFTDFLDTLTIWRFLFGAPHEAVGSEYAYIVIFTNFGMVGLVAVLALVVIAVGRSVSTARLARDAGQLKVARIYQALGAYVVAFSVAGLGVPYFNVFPVNMLFWLVAMLAVIRPRLGASDEPVPISHAHEMRMERSD
ncbi:MAG: hypothetical protein KUG57_05630 [Ilumatobacteraceae bacterium]|nr:hypothetical protein [Ilumatobacteraceae bacterium]